MYISPELAQLIAYIIAFAIGKGLGILLGKKYAKKLKDAIVGFLKAAAKACTSPIASKILDEAAWYLENEVFDADSLATDADRHVRS